MQKNLGYLLAAILIVLGAMQEVARGADLAVKAQPVPNQIVAAPAQNWTGWYLGAFVGYSWGNNTPSVSSDHWEGSSFGGPDLRMDGALLGAQVGYDWQVAPRVVVGLAADLAWAGVHGATSFHNIQMTKDMKMLGNLDARAGYLITPQTMAYVLGGLSVARFSSDINTIGWSSGLAGSEGSTKWGWNIGGGLESKLSSQWSIFGDARYFKFNDSSTPVIYSGGEGQGTIANVSTRNAYSAFRIGLNWKPPVN